MRGKKIAVPQKTALMTDIAEMSKPEIAKKYKASVTTVNRWLKSYDLKDVKRADIHFSKDIGIDKPSVPKMDKSVATANTKPDRPVPVKEKTKPAEKDRTMYDPYSKASGSLDLMLSSLILSDISLTGFEICRTESSLKNGISQDDLNDIVEKEIKKEFPEEITEGRLYHTTDDTYYIITMADQMRSDVKKAKTLKWILWDKYGIFLALYNRRGFYYTDSTLLRKDVDNMLKYLKDNASEHIVTNYYIPDDSAKGPVIQENISEQINKAQTPVQHLTSKITIDPDLAKGLPDDVEERVQYIPEPLSGDEDDSPAEDDTSEDAVLKADCTSVIMAEEKTPVREVHFIDSENVSAQWKNILSNDPSVETVILYTDHTPKIGYDTLAEILKHPLGIKLIKVFEGEKAGSALDFQLVSIMGFMINEHPERKYVIVSLDKGYDPCVSYWKTKDIDVSRLPMINRDLPEGETAFAVLSDEEKKQRSAACTNDVEKAFHTPSAVPVDKKPDPRDGATGKCLDRIVFLQKILPGREKSIYDSIINILADKNETDLKHIHADIIGVFGGRSGEVIYKKIKKNIKAYKAI